MANKDCKKCGGTGIVKNETGGVHTCWDCLERGDMDQHSKDLKESDIRI